MIIGTDILDDSSGSFPFWDSKIEETEEAFRLAAINFIKMVKENPESVEDRLRDFITYQEQKGEIKRITLSLSNLLDYRHRANKGA